VVNFVRVITEKAPGEASSGQDRDRRVIRWQKFCI